MLFLEGFWGPYEEFSIGKPKLEVYKQPYVYFIGRPAKNTDKN